MLRASARMDGRIDGRTDGRRNGWMEGRMDGWKGEETKGAERLRTAAEIPPPPRCGRAPNAALWGHRPRSQGL